MDDNKWAEPAVLGEAAPGQRRMQASLARASLCGPARQALRAGKVRTLQPRLSDLEIGGQRVVVRPLVDTEVPCRDNPAAQQDAARR